MSIDKEKIEAIKVIIKEAESFADKQLLPIGVIGITALKAIRRIIREK